VKGSPGVAGPSDDDPRRRSGIAAVGRAVGGLSSRSATLSERKGFSPDANRRYTCVGRGESAASLSVTGSIVTATPQPRGLDRRDELPKRAATLWSARSAEAEPSGAARAPATGGSQTSGGTVRFAVGADCCGAIGCGETVGLLVVEVEGKRRVLCPRCARRWAA